MSKLQKCPIQVTVLILYPVFRPRRSQNGLVGRERRADFLAHPTSIKNIQTALIKLSRFIELIPFAKRFEPFEPLDRVAIGRKQDFGQAFGAHVQWAAIGLAHVIAATHVAVVGDAMLDRKHMARFVGRQF